MFTRSWDNAKMTSLGASHRLISCQQKRHLTFMVNPRVCNENMCASHVVVEKLCTVVGNCCSAWQLGAECQEPLFSTLAPLRCS